MSGHRGHRVLIGGVTLLVIIIVVMWNQADRPAIADAPTWNGITPSETTREEVMAILGEPDNTWLCVVLQAGVELRSYEAECELPAGVVHYGYYHELLPGKPYGWHEIHFNQNNTVDYVVETRWPDPNVESMSTEVMLLRYGRPERVTWSLRGGYIRALLYCEQGLILHVVLVHGRDDARDIGIREVVYFAPMTTDECIDKFYDEISTSNPYEGSHIEETLDPWGFNTVQN